MNPQHSPDWKGCPPRVRKIAVVDDDENHRRQLVEHLTNKFPKLTIRDYEDIFECYQGICCFDYIIIDVSSVAPMMMSDVQNAWAPIAKYLEHYPGTSVIIQSGMSANATQDVIDEVRKYASEDRVIYGGHGFWNELEIVLDRLIKPEYMEWTKVNRKKK